MKYFKKIVKITKINLFIIIILFAVWFLLHSIILTYVGLKGQKLTDIQNNKNQIIVVMGSAFYKDLKPTEILARRLDAAFRITKKKQEISIYLSGGYRYKNFLEGLVAKNTFSRSNT